MRTTLSLLGTLTSTYALVTHVALASVCVLVVTALVAGRTRP